MRRFFVFSLLISAISFFHEVVAQDQPGSTRPPAWAAPNRSIDDDLSVPEFDKIFSAVRNEGRVRVIIRMKGSSSRAQDSPANSESAAVKMDTERRSSLSRLQDRILNRLSYRTAARAKNFEFIPYMAVEVDEFDLYSLLDSPEIDFIEEDRAVPPLLSQSGPLVGADGNGTFSGFTGNGITVAILDTGVDRSHPFLSGKVVSEACYSTTGPCSQSVCPNGQSSQTGTGAGVNCDPSISGCSHGTHVTGIAAGKGQVFNGVAKDASIIAIQVFSQFTPSYCGSSSPCVLSYSSDQIAGLQRIYALKDTYRIAAVNMSLGGGTFNSYCDSANVALKAAIDALRFVGIATIISSGNNSSSAGISAPACISSAISIGATTKSDEIANYSNSASILSLLAPGSSIYSSIPGGGYAYYGGTSMAAPHVTAAWAILKSKKATATVDEVFSALKSTGSSITDTRNGIIKPRIKVDAALSQISSQSTAILWRHVDGRLVVWNMSGTNRESTAYLNGGNAVDNAWKVTGVGDFNGDGKPDILWRHIDGRLVAWIMNGINRTAVSWLNNQNPVDTNWTLSAVADFNGDGKPDIYWRHRDGRLVVWNMDGVNRVGVTWLNNQNPVDPNWTLAAVTDFNSDGKPDILWRHKDGRLVIWDMDGANRVGVSWLNGQNPVDIAWNVAGVADFNGDNNPDILWHHNDGRIVAWFMNGINRLNTTYLNTGNPVNTVWDVATAYIP